LFAKKDRLHILNASSESSASSKGEIVSAGERFILKLYVAPTASTLGKLRYTCYKSVEDLCPLRKSELESLPPTSAAAKQHLFRTYIIVQQWKRNLLNPTVSGVAHS